jgi:hypothetical protein
MQGESVFQKAHFFSYKLFRGSCLVSAQKETYFLAIADNYYSCYVIYCPEVDMNGKGPKIRPRPPRTVPA